MYSGECREYGYRCGIAGAGSGWNGERCGVGLPVMRALRWLLIVAFILTPLPRGVTAWLPLAGSGSGGGGSPTWTAQTSGVNVACGFITTCNIASVTVPTGFIVVGALVHNAGGSSGTISGVSACGTPLTQAQTNTIPSAGDGVALFYGSVTGGTCTVAVTFSVASAVQDAGVALGLLSNLSSTTPGTGCQAQYPGSQNAPYDCSGSITVPSGGFGICAIGYNNVTALTSSNLTINSQSAAGTGGDATAVGIGSTTVTGTPTFGGTNFAQAGIACAPWS